GHVNRFNRLLMLRLHDVARVAVQNPVHLDDYNEPQPDLALLRSRPDFYSAAHPTPADILALVEVSDTSLAYDRRVKALLYAQHGIPAYLMLDPPRQTLTVFREPSPEGYGSMQTLRRGDHWAPLAFPDRQITVTDLLGEA
ncbi:MAG: Uma2 family endonuclease, partial [Chloroflexi bacterium]|nr:Uma2 family endonuclease [Chloroflexota bacterium]